MEGFTADLESTCGHAHPGQNVANSIGTSLVLFALTCHRHTEF